MLLKLPHFALRLILNIWCVMIEISVKLAQYLEIHNEMLPWGSFGLHRLTIEIHQ